MAATIGTSSLASDFKIAMITQPFASASLFPAELATYMTYNWTLITVYADSANHVAILKQTGQKSI